LLFVDKKESRQKGSWISPVEKEKAILMMTAGTYDPFS
jgi:hypothetical protein